MRYPCQECGRPATYQRKQVARKSADRIKGRKDHDVCGSCWKKMMMRKQAVEMKEAA